MTPGQTFNASIDKWLGTVKTGLPALARQSIQTIAFNVVVDTPVLTGFLRGSWQPSIGANEPPLKPETDTDPQGALAMAEISLKIAGMPVGGKYWMINGAAYAMRIEYGFVGEDSLGRYYNQKGRYFVTRNVARWPEVVAAEAKKIWG
jgi:hypothetical protein